MNWFKKRKLEREELEKKREEVITKFFELYNMIPELTKRVNAVQDNVTRLQTYPNRVEVRSETLMAAVRLPSDNITAKDVEEMLAIKLADGVSKNMCVYKYYDPQAMEYVFKGIVKVIPLNDQEKAVFDMYNTSRR